MKKAAILLVALAMPVYAAEPVTYEQLASIKLDESMCPRIDEYVNFYERQLKLKGLLNATPEELNDNDRKYNAEARLAIWSLRIGCNNPNRYK